MVKHKVILFFLSVTLILGATVVLLFLKKIPFPARLVLAAADYGAAAALLLYMRQKYSEK